MKLLTQKQMFEANKATVVIFNLIMSKRTYKILFILLALSSFYLNYRFVRSNYALRCGVNGEVVARFISQAKCNDLAEAKLDALEFARVQRVEANQDIY